jgi:anti-sigma factor RsiW
MNEPLSIEEELTAYVDGELSQLDARRVEAALAADPRLAALERQLRATLKAVEALAGPQPSPALRRSVLDALEAPLTLSEQLRQWLRPSRLMPVLGMAAAAVLMVVVAKQGEHVGAAHESDAEQLFVAQNMEILEDLDLAGLESPEDLEVVAALDALEHQP